MVEIDQILGCIEILNENILIVTLRIIERRDTPRLSERWLSFVALSGRTYCQYYTNVSELEVVERELVVTSGHELGDEQVLVPENTPVPWVVTPRATDQERTASPRYRDEQLPIW